MIIRIVGIELDQEQGRALLDDIAKSCTLMGQRPALIVLEPDFEHEV